jgi:hypothetical protein
MKRFAVLCTAALLATAAIAHAQSQHQRSTTAGAYRYGVAEVCRDLNMYEALKPTVPMLLGLNQRQQASWKDVESALADARKPIDTGCGKLKTMPSGGAANAQAARLEIVLSSSLDAVRRVRPSFDRFYATLDDTQKRQVDKIFENTPL